MVGTALVLVSAVSFGTLAILAKLGYRAGLGPEQLLTFRFLLGSIGMAVVCLVTRHNPFRLPLRTFAVLLAMGTIGYFGQSTTFFIALQSLPASLVELLTYTYPAMVVVAGFMLFRHHLPGVQLAALVGSFGGVVLLVGGIRLAGGAGLVFAILSPILYTTYLLVGARVTRDIDGITAGTLSIAGTALTWLAYAAATGNLRPPSGTIQWLVVVGLAVVPTMLAITTLLAALPRIGAARASLLSTVEPVVTVTLAVLLLGDRFKPLQVAGAALILASVVVLQLPRRGSGPAAAAPQ
ncbi:MAG: EamA family transporter [Candidatus Dormibacteraceae bacterium]